MRSFLGKIETNSDWFTRYLVVKSLFTQFTHTQLPSALISLQNAKYATKVKREFARIIIITKGTVIHAISILTYQSVNISFFRVLGVESMTLKEN